MTISIPTGAVADPERRAAIRKLFEPKSIVIVGASADPTKLGSSPLRAMEVLGYRGTISIVNPRHTEMMGHRCFPSIDALPEGIDAAMVIVPAPAATDAAEALVAKGIEAIVMIPQGFGESGAEGRQRDLRLLALAERGIAITGPNTNGIANVAAGVAMSIGPIFVYPGRVQPGRVGVVSQSGAMVSSLLTKLQRCGIGIGKSATCGNELVLTVADYIDFMADDPDTDIIVLYLETIRDIVAFRAAVARARAAEKPIVAIKVGESESGQKATLSHTGAIAGSYRNTIAFLEREGIFVADDLESLAHIVELLMRYDWRREIKPARRFVASISGGFAAQTADLMARLGIPLEDPSPAGAAKLSALPTQSHPVNPYDIAAQNALIPQIIDIFRDDGFNQLIFGLVLLKPEINDQVAAMLIEAKARGMDKLIAVSPSVEPTERERFNEAGILITDDAYALAKALSAIEKHALNASLGAAAVRAADLPTMALDRIGGRLDEAASKRLIEVLGIQAPRSVVLPVRDGLADLSTLRRPLVMKGLSDKIAHKSEYGLVALGLQTDEAIATAWDRIVGALAKADPDAGSILIEEMVGSGLEVILGVQHDPTIGPVVVLGAGGILVELLDDAVVLVPPFSPEQARLALERTKIGRLLTGFRGRAYDIDALVQAAATLGDIALAQPRLHSVDINPVLVQPDRGGIIAVDAKIELGS